MKTTQLGRWLNVSASTIRKWTDDFGEYLSPKANARAGGVRVYDETDRRMMAVIADMRNENAPMDDIHAALQQIVSSDYADLPPMPAALDPSVGAVPMVPREAADTALQITQQRLQRDIVILEEKVEDLTERLNSEEADHATTRAELHQTQLELGKAQGRLEGIDGERRARQQYQNALLVILVIVAVLAIALLVWPTLTPP